MEQLINSTLVSEVQDIVFPSLPGTASVTKLATLFQLEQSQWWSEETLLEQQLKQVKKLIAHSIQYSPYYHKLKDLKLNLNNFTYDEFKKIPILTRDNVQEFGPQLHSQFVPPSHGKSYLQKTSGSTGKPIQSLSTEINSFFWNVFTLRDHLWHKRKLNKRLAVVRFTLDEKAKKTPGIHSNNWGRATQGVYQTGDCFILSILTPISELVTWLLEIKPYYLLTHPSVLKELAIYCKNKSIELPFLGEVRTLSEALPDDLRKLCKDTWNLQLIDVYSTIELGYLALQCPDNNHYHVQSESILLEILDDNNQPCRPGEIGKVVATSLHNFAFPLIRYEIGDYAEVGSPCSCGRGLPVIKRILGRYRNLLTMPTGEKQYPQLDIQNLYKIAPVLQFQAIQKSLTNIDISLVLTRPLINDEEHLITEKFKNMIGSCFNYTINQVPHISRTKNGKYEEFMSDIA